MVFKHQIYLRNLFIQPNVSKPNVSKYCILFGTTVKATHLRGFYRWNHTLHTNCARDKLCYRHSFTKICLFLHLLSYILLRYISFDMWVVLDWWYEFVLTIISVSSALPYGLHSSAGMAPMSDYFRFHDTLDLLISYS
jgi:hypothetical protein